MDTNPFAVSPNAQQPQQPQMSPIGASTVTSAPGGVAAMVKAIMDGNNQYKMQQAKMPPPGGPLGAMSSPQPAGPPMSLAPPMGAGAGKGGMPPSAGPMAPMTPMDGSSNPNPSMPPLYNGMAQGGGMPPDPFSQGTSPIPGLMPQGGGDPVTQALFSPIPGMPNG